MPPPPREPELRYRPVSARRRVLIGLVAVATAVTIILLMLGPALRLREAQGSGAPTPPPCTGGNLNECLGGKASVILQPPAPPASAARPTSPPDLPVTR